MNTSRNHLILNSFFHSFRGQYIFVSFVIALALISGSLATHNFFSSTSGKLLQQSRLNLKNLNETSLLMDQLWEVQYLLGKHAVISSEDLHKEIYATIAAAEDRLAGLIVADHAASSRQILLQQTAENLQHLKQAVTRLLNVRSNPALLYPAIQISRSDMFNHQREFNALLDLNINEILYDGIEKNRDVLIKLMRLQYKWSQMISVNRMYLLNRLATLSIEQLKSQVENVETYYASVSTALAELMQLEANGNLTFQVAESLPALKQMATGWHEQFRKVIATNNPEIWRTDYPLIKNKIGPLTHDIWGSIQEVEQSIRNDLQNSFISLSETGASTSNLLAMLSACGLFSLFLVFYFIDARLIKPVEKISKAMRLEAKRETENSDIPSQGHSLETDNLIDAFSYLQLQLRLRENQLEHQALHDALTGLPNRVLLMDRLEQTIVSAKRNNSSLALFMLDMDRFKEINDTLGHHVGDELLKQMAHRLVSVLRRVDTVARLGGDEFAILIPDCDTDQSVQVAKKIKEAIKPAVQTGDKSFYIRASFGIATYPEHGDDAVALMRYADIAMYFAKRMNSGYEIYHQQQDKMSFNKLAVKQEMQKAFLNNEFVLHYQPQLDCRTLEVVGVEALIRWIGLGEYKLSPNVFIPLAEESGLIKQLTEWVIEETIQQQKIWQNQGHRIHTSINLSAWNLLDPELEHFIVEQFTQHAVSRDSVSFEITESAMMTDTEQALSIMNSISDFGLNLIIDDYGTGFSSLAYIKKFPVSELKIDKSFVINMLDSANDAVIVKSTIELAHNLGLKVLAEGVENQRTLELLQQLGCDKVQGYFVSYPLPADDLVEWLRNFNGTETLLVD